MSFVWSDDAAKHLLKITSDYKILKPMENVQILFINLFIYLYIYTGTAYYKEANIKRVL